MEINALEHDILAKLLAGNNAVLDKLREQWACAVVSTREMTGAGFFTSFFIRKHVPRVTPQSFQLTDVTLEIEGLKHGAGVVLFVSDGYLDQLECYTWADEDWPEQVQVRSIRYLSETQTGPTSFQLTPAETRDPAALRRQLGESLAS